MLGLGLRVQVNGGQYIRPFVKDSLSILRDSDYTFDNPCTVKYLNNIYLNDSSSLYNIFTHTYDTLELASYTVDRYCLQSSVIQHTDAQYDELYRAYIANVRAVSSSNGSEFLGESPFIADNPLYRTADAFDDEGLWYDFTVLEITIAASGAEIVDRGVLYRTYKSFAA